MSDHAYRTDVLTEEETYWLDKLSTDINMSSFAVNGRIAAGLGSQESFFTYKLPDEISRKIINMSNRSEYGIFIILLCGVQYLLSIYTGSKDVALGTPVLRSKSGASFQDHQLIIRNDIHSGMSFKDFLLNVQQTIAKANKNQKVSHDRLAKLLGFELSATDRLQPKTVVLLENIHHNGSMHHAYADTVFNFKWSGSHIDCRISYKENIGEVISNIPDQLTHFFKAVVENPHIRLSEIDILAAERNRILYEFNETTADYPEDKSVVELFELQVTKTPQKTAVAYQDQHLTYQELNMKANRIAHVLLEHGIGEDSVVGIMVERSLELPIGILGILKAGGAYLPIDPNYPAKRIQHLIRHSEADIILKCSREQIDAVDQPIPFIDIDTTLDCGTPEEMERNPGLDYSPEGIMYVLYTSGSTGEPKGVMVKRKSFVNLLTWYTREFEMDETDNVLLIAPISFDTAHKNVFAPLITGGRLYLFEPGAYDYDKMSADIEQYQITIINCTPSGFYPLVDYNKKTDYSRLTSLCYVFLGGEPINSKKLKPWIESANFKGEMVNTYGPTECTDLVSFYKINEREVKHLQNIPIGKPLYNTQIYIVDQDMNPLPIGVTGELCIGGVGLARAYCRAPRLTSEKFVQFPYFPGKKVYKTGDLARWMPDGNIEFIGRRDNQIKIRGFRVEAGEVEACLIKHRDVEEAVVVATEDTVGTRVLSAYFVSKVKIENGALRSFLSESLPEFMIPAYFTQLEKLPLNHNGKIDRNALPAPDMNMVSSSDYVAPDSEIERKIAYIWEEVLNIERIGIYDNFFELGGHSLKAAAIVLKINQVLQTNLRLSEMFRQPTIKGLALRISAMQQRDDLAILPVKERAYYPASSQQKRLFVLWQLDPDSTAYHLPSATMIDGNIRLEKLSQTFQHLVDRHEALRTSFELVEGRLLQRVHRRVEVEVDVGNAREDQLLECIQNFVKPFDLAQSPLFRVKVIKVEENKHLLLTDAHHIVLDGLSLDIIMEEFADYYAEKNLPQVKLQYRDYAVWQEEFFHSADFQSIEDYWLNLFQDGVPVLDLNTDYPRRQVQHPNGDHVSITVSTDLTSRLKRTAAENETTLYTVLLAALNVLLFKYTGQEDIAIGTPTAGRTRPGLERVIGMFVNTVVMRNFPHRNKTFRKFLKEVQNTTLQALEHEEYPFEVLVDQLGVQRNTGRNPLFDLMFSLDNDDGFFTHSGALPFHNFPVENNTTQFDLFIHARETKDSINFKLKYRTCLFNKDTVERMANHLIRLLETIVRHTDLPLQEMQILSARERDIMLSEFNNTEAGYFYQQTMPALLERQAKETPAETAVVYQELPLTYAQLDAKTNQLARILRKKGVHRNSIVGIVAEPSSDMIIGVLGVLKAGGAYLPIDPDFPISRVSYLLEDSDCQLILAQRHVQEKLVVKTEVVLLDDETIHHEDDSGLNMINQPDDLAYVMYTSGTTGHPKGVLIEHKNLVNQMLGLIETLQVEQALHHLLLAKFTFDVSVQQMLLPLICGGTLYIPEQEVMAEPRKLWNFIKHNDINVIGAVPTHLKVLLKGTVTCHRLRYVLVAGEVFTNDLLADLRNTLHTAVIMNLYGPTETTIFATLYVCNGQEAGPEMPIGKPLSNYRAYILDQNLQPVPLGATGELYIAGAGVARGYVNKPELTSERFVSDPFVPGQRMYKTGDLARWLPDSNIAYIGRTDHQVKMNGIRIEPGEIREQILNHERVRDAVMITKQNEFAETYLCAYVVTDEVLTATELRGFLENRLPAYMIPSRFVNLDNVPFTSNGKVDVQALQERTDDDRVLLPETAYIEPTTHLEKTIAGIWQDILGVERVGIRDHFFDLGGNSLHIVEMNERLKEELHIDLPVVMLFRHTTIASLVHHLQSEPLTTRQAAKREQVIEESKTRLKQRMQRRKQKGDEDES